MPRHLSEAETFFTEKVRQFIQEDAALEQRLRTGIHEAINVGINRLDIDTALKRSIMNMFDETLNSFKNTEGGLAREFAVYGFHQVDWSNIVDTYCAEVEQEMQQGDEDNE